MDLKNKKILIVGGAGFIGHNLAIQLKKLNAEVSIIDSLGINNLESLKNTNRVQLNDITDNAQFSIIKNFNAENTNRNYIQSWKRIISI